MTYVSGTSKQWYIRGCSTLNSIEINLPFASTDMRICYKHKRLARLQW